MPGDTEAKESKTSCLLSSWCPLIPASSAGVCHPPLGQTDVCLPVYCSWPGRLVGAQASALSLTLWNTTAVRLLPDSMLIVWFNSPMFNHEGKGRERGPQIMIIALKFFCVWSHLYTFRVRCHFPRVCFFSVQTKRRKTVNVFDSYSSPRNLKVNLQKWRYEVSQSIKHMCMQTCQSLQGQIELFSVHSMTIKRRRMNRLAPFDLGQQWGSDWLCSYADACYH